MSDSIALAEQRSLQIATSQPRKGPGVLLRRGRALVDQANRRLNAPRAGLLPPDELVHGSTVLVAATATPEDQAVCRAIQSSIGCGLCWNSR